MIELRTPEEIVRMHRTGRFVAEVLTELAGAARAGTTLLELDELAHRRIREAGAVSCYVDYAPSFGTGPFGKVLCTSVNDAVLHGLPHDRPLSDGDLLSLDFAVALDGWVADSALSLVVGTPDPEDLRLVEATEQALAAGIAAARPGGRLGDVSAAIAQVAADHGYPVNTDFGGHGVGRTMHGEPFVPNAGRAGTGPELRPGLVIAVEPWFLAGTDRLRQGADGWTLFSADGSRGAHSEHTIAITEDGPLVLTARD